MTSSVSSPIPAVRGTASARRGHILDAAETCFARNGFHPTTMQDIAREARMSPGNIYRYLASKEAVVVALAERDRERGRALIAELEKERDPRGVFEGVIARFFLETSRDVAILRVDLWSESTRNPTIAALKRRQEAERREWMIEIFTKLATSPLCDPAALCETISPLLKGMIVNRAISPNYDPAPSVRLLLDIVDAGLAGQLKAGKACKGRTINE
ncbi:MAG: TetR/AcrR family transcriptional regulator [Beijerinckiaceae bacterium]|nr:TetR/AcrR family transcriptional regulator [Beijerinckiaceae bacterium]